jgi:hypothetical protein
MSVVQITAKLCIVALALLAFVAPVSAASVIFLANPPAGNDNNTCSFASPCQTLGTLGRLDSNGQVTCAQGTAFGSNFIAALSVTVDCPGLFVPNQTALQGFLGEFEPDGIVITIRHLTINGQFAGTGALGVSITGGSGSTLVLEDCVFENFSGTAIQIAPNGPYTLILRNTRMLNNGAGVVLKPAAGGSITATLDHVTISRNNGGGLKTDTTSGAVTLDVTDSVVSSNTGNGLNAVGGAGGPAMLSIHNSVIAKNGAAGVQVNGATAAAMIDTTLLDSNASGATAVVNGGHMLTYGNNRTVGSPGSGFTGTAPLN